MKKFILLAGAVLLMVAGAMTSCRSDDDEPFVTTVSVKDIIGIVQFDNQSNRWALCAIASGTIDNVKKYYPIELERDFQKEGLNVIFSGDVSEMPLEAGTPAGTESYFIKLTSMGICNIEEQNSPYGQCFTIRINGISTPNIVSGTVITLPEDATFTGHSIVLFDNTDLPGLNVSHGDELDIMILSYKEVPVDGYTTGETNYYYCKVNYCK